MAFNARKLGRRIFHIRREKKMSAEELSAKAGIGLYYLHEIERGALTPSLALLVRIANLLEVRMNDLLGDYLETQSTLPQPDERDPVLSQLDFKQMLLCLDTARAYAEFSKYDLAPEQKEEEER